MSDWQKVLFFLQPIGKILSGLFCHRLEKFEIFPWPTDKNSHFFYDQKQGLTNPTWGGSWGKDPISVPYNMLLAIFACIKKKIWFLDLGVQGSCPICPWDNQTLIRKTSCFWKKVKIESKFFFNIFFFFLHLIISKYRFCGISQKITYRGIPWKIKRYIFTEKSHCKSKNFADCGETEIKIQKEIIINISFL